jgi:D-beta-D-heptose 7-phosphate kinase/D-beta-D-heptose 1-phosphate adenosyltransferase
VKVIDQKRLGVLLKKMARTRILVIGDIVLDEYVWGTVSRISQEAPIPVVHVQREEFRPGGATNVANNIVALGGQADMAGLVGEDRFGSVLTGELRALGVDTDAVVTDPSRPTAVKTRVIARVEVHQHQQVVRIDRECPAAMDHAVTERLLELVRARVPGCRGMVLSDYAKGIFSHSFIREVLGAARKHGVKVIVDPKPVNIRAFAGADLISPNQIEADQASGVRITDPVSLRKAGRILIQKLKCKAVLITRGDQGMTLFERGKSEITFTALAREVFDVAGAGDTVKATLALAWAAGATLREAVALSNYSAGVVVGKIGAATVSPKELTEAVRRAR